jgi:putative two-component system response regulator
MSVSASQTILIVDDAPANLNVFSGLLAPHYRVLVANSGARGLILAQSTPQPDLILLDVMMPGMDGYEVFHKLREDRRTREIPVIFVTGMTGAQDESHGLQAGAVDYITKPVVPAVLLARVRTQLELKLARDCMRDQNAWLETEVNKRMAENDVIQNVSIRALARLAETRDPETGNHILRTQGYVQALAQALRTHARFETTLSDQYIRLLARSAPLHDIGKVGIPDSILRKPGPLDADEWCIMKTHATIGGEALEQAERDAADATEADGAPTVQFLRLAKEIARSHHEKWDGTGYPLGLRGDAIPVSARIMAVADVFDALISPRVYKKAMPQWQAREIILAGRGAHFDPDMVDAFVTIFEELCAIAERYSDAQEEALA